MVNGTASLSASASLVSSSNVNATIGGANGESWWHVQNNTGVTHAETMLGHYNYVTSEITIDPTSHSTIYISGRGGIWKSTDSGSSWYPMVQGLSTVVSRDTAAEPVSASQNVAEADVDWTATLSASRYLDGPVAEEPSVKGGYVLAFDPNTTPPALYLGGGAAGSGSSNGYVAYFPNPFTSPGTYTLLPAVPPNTGNPVVNLQVIGLAASSSGGTQTVVIVVKNDTGNGVYWSQCTGTCTTTANWSTWAASSLPTGSQLGESPASPKVDMWWPKGSSYLFIFDPATGIWRSNGSLNSYTSFTNIWALPSTSENAKHTDHLAGDPTTGKRIYFTTRDQAYVIDDASTCSGTCTVRSIPNTTIPRPGTVAVDASGNAFIAELPTGSGNTPTLYQCATVTTTCDTPVAVTDTTNTSTYPEFALFTNGMSMGSDDTAYIALDGSGVAVVPTRPQE